MKKLLVLGIILLSTFLIYLSTFDRKIYYLSLGDSLALGVTPYGGYDYGYSDYVRDEFIKQKKLEKYVIGYAKENYRTIDLINDIKNNKVIKVNDKNITLKNALIKADIITISIGINDFLSYTTLKNISNNQIYDYIDEAMIDIETLLKSMREYCKEDIIYIGYYNYFNNESLDKAIQYGNTRLKEICDKYQITYLDTYSIFNENKDLLPNPIDIHPSREGYINIGERIIKEFFD